MNNFVKKISLLSFIITLFFLGSAGDIYAAKVSGGTTGNTSVGQCKGSESFKDAVKKCQTNAKNEAEAKCRKQTIKVSDSACGKKPTKGTCPVGEVLVGFKCSKTGSLSDVKLKQSGAKNCKDANRYFDNASELANIVNQQEDAVKAAEEAYNEAKKSGDKDAARAARDTLAQTKAERDMFSKMLGDPSYARGVAKDAARNYSSAQNEFLSAKKSQEKAQANLDRRGLTNNNAYNKRQAANSAAWRAELQRDSSKDWAEFSAGYVSAGKGLICSASGKCTITAVWEPECIPSLRAAPPEIKKLDACPFIEGVRDEEIQDSVPPGYKVDANGNCTPVGLPPTPARAVPTDVRLPQPAGQIETGGGLTPTIPTSPGGGGVQILSQFRLGGGELGGSRTGVSGGVGAQGGAPAAPTGQTMFDAVRSVLGF